MNKMTKEQQKDLWSITKGKGLGINNTGIVLNLNQNKKHFECSNYENFKEMKDDVKRFLENKQISREQLTMF